MILKLVQQDDERSTNYKGVVGDWTVDLGFDYRKEVWVVDMYKHAKWARFHFGTQQEIKDFIIVQLNKKEVPITHVEILSQLDAAFEAEILDGTNDENM
jgi:hypothetical protein